VTFNFQTKIDPATFLHLPDIIPVLELYPSNYQGSFTKATSHLPKDV